jgi:hypothetical protein
MVERNFEQRKLHDDHYKGLDKEGNVVFRARVEEHTVHNRQLLYLHF